MSINIFFDSSALIAGIVSSQGAARALLLLAEDNRLSITISEQVLVEVERNLARKVPQVLPFAREMIRCAQIKIVRDPSKEDITPYMDWMQHAADVPILVSAMRLQADYLVTHNSKHFMDQTNYLSKQSGLRIGSLGDALIWVRSRFENHL
jgi:predicted nucleic acid-binding protein